MLFVAGAILVLIPFVFFNSDKMPDKPQTEDT
jgi:hypothetical protein